MMAWKSWGKGGGGGEEWRWWGEGEGGRGWAKGALAASLLRRLGDFDLRFFLADALEMGCLVKCWTVELKGWRQDREIPSTTQNSSPRLYPKFHLTFNSH